MFSTLGGKPLLFEYRHGMEHPPRYSWYPLHVSWYPPAVLKLQKMISLHGTEHPTVFMISPTVLSFHHGTRDSPMVLMITPMVLKISPTFIMISPKVLKISHHITHDIPHGTEHTLYRVRIYKLLIRQESSGHSCNFLLALETSRFQNCSATKVKDGSTCSQLVPISATCCDK